MTARERFFKSLIRFAPKLKAVRLQEKLYDIGLNACPTNSTPGLVKASPFSVGQATLPVRPLASEVFIPISKELQVQPKQHAEKEHPPAGLPVDSRIAVAELEPPDQ